MTQVLSEAVGHRVPESEVLQRMTTLGMQLPTSTQGVPFDDAERLLDSFGISSHQEHHVTLARLEGYLDQGRSVILGVDADPIWHYQDGTSQGPAPHAVMITSIDESTGTVTLSDTGNPHGGNEERVPLKVFMYAWGEQGNQLVVTDSVIAHHPGPVLMPLTIHPFTTHLPTHSVPRLANPEVPDGLAQPGDSYAVQPGDTLWDIAERAYGSGADYTVIAAANGITDPDHIVAGRRSTIQPSEHSARRLSTWRARRAQFGCGGAGSHRRRTRSPRRHRLPVFPVPFGKHRLPVGHRLRRWRAAGDRGLSGRRPQLRRTASPRRLCRWLG